MVVTRLPRSESRRSAASAAACASLASLLALPPSASTCMSCVRANVPASTAVHCSRGRRIQVERLAYRSTAESMNWEAMRFDCRLSWNSVRRARTGAGRVGARGSAWDVVGAMVRAVATV